MDDLKAKLLEANLEAAKQSKKFFVDNSELLKKGFDKTIADLEKQIADSEVTYSIGDRFVDGSDGHKVILSVVATRRACLIDLKDGRYLKESVAIKLLGRITQEEFSAMYKHTITRYWDARKQEKC